MLVDLEIVGRNDELTKRKKEMEGWQELSHGKEENTLHHHTEIRGGANACFLRSILIYCVCICQQERERERLKEAYKLVCCKSLVLLSARKPGGKGG